MAQYRASMIWERRMGTDNLYWKHKAELARLENRRDQRETILIVCEGEKTEPNYFQAFPVTSADVKIVPLGVNTRTVVEYAIDIQREGARRGICI